MSFKSRSWQNKSFKIVDDVVETSKKTVIPVNACVGSGKTAVACYAFGKNILENKDKNTIQFFVTPRIRLCDQQNKEIEEFLKIEFNLNNEVDYHIIPIDCTKNIFSKDNDSLVSKHTIFVICDESLWGTTTLGNGIKTSRWHKWNSRFKKWQDNGYMFGCFAFDEAHNYQNNTDYINESLNFGFVMLMSGTPAAYQRELSKKYPENICDCPPKLAMNEGWICKPNLNLVVGSKMQWPLAIKAVLNKEIKICENELFAPRIMINCSSIDEIKHLNELQWIKDRIGKEFHFITIHSLKQYENPESSTINKVMPMVDGKEVDAQYAYEVIEKIDSNAYFTDTLPILVAQVQMLGEGINVCSFNACLTSSNSDKTAMQQIGRIIRNYTIEGISKVKHGHANVYTLIDNYQSLYTLLMNLAEYDLTDECFSWGDKLDISTGSSFGDDEDNTINELNEFNWEAIDPDTDLEIIELMELSGGKQTSKHIKSFVDSYFSGDEDEFTDLISLLEEAGLLKIWKTKKFTDKQVTSLIKKDRGEELVKLKTPNEKGETKNKETYVNKYEIVYSLIKDFSKLLKYPNVKKYAKCDFEGCLEYSVGNKKIADCFAKCIPNTLKESLLK